MILKAYVCKTKLRDMKTFEKQSFNEQVVTEDTYIQKFTDLGFIPYSTDLCFTNGASFYATISVVVANEGKMYGENFTYDGKCTLKVRISDHQSNLERICGGVSGNNLSFDAFVSLVNNGAILPNN